MDLIKNKINMRGAPYLYRRPPVRGGPVLFFIRYAIAGTANARAAN